ncbi:MAG: outer membrane beta-barrel protein [Bacteroidota bacterium]
MKIIKWFLFIVFLQIAFSSSAQKIKGMLILGMNMSQVDGDRVFGYHKFGVNAGVGAILPISDAFSIHVETLLNQKGARQGVRYEDSLDGSYKMNLQYAEVPFYLNFFDKKGKMSIGAGFSYGKLVGFTEKQNGYKIEFPHTYITKPKSTDFSGFLNLYVPIKAGLKLNFRYSYSLQSIRKRYFSDGAFREQYNNVLSFRLIYIFNDKVKLKDD